MRWLGKRAASTSAGRWPRRTGAPRRPAGAGAGFAPAAQRPSAGLEPASSPGGPRLLGAGPQVRAARRQWRRPIQISLLVLLLVDLLFFVLAFRPAGQTFAEQRQTLDRLRDDFQKRRQAVEHLQKIEANLAEARRQGDQFYKTQFLPKATGFSVIMEEVDRLASATGVRKGSVTYNLTEVKGRGDLEAVEITTALEGEYPRLVQFINHLEHSSLFLIVDSLAVAGGASRSGVRLSVRLVTHFRTA